MKTLGWFVAGIMFALWVNEDRHVCPPCNKNHYYMTHPTYYPTYTYPTITSGSETVPYQPTTTDTYYVNN